MVDFLISDNQNSLFIDAKGVEPNDTVLTTDSPRVIKDKLRDHLMKGISQAVDAASNMSLIFPEEYSQINSRYVLIVTHQDFFLNNAKTLHNYLGEEYQNKLNDILRNQINIENIYFCSVADLESILVLCNEVNTNIFEFLKHCVVSDSKPETGKFHMTQHIESFAELNKLKERANFSNLILTEFDNNHQELMQCVDKSRKFWQQSMSNIPYFLRCVREIKS